MDVKQHESKAKGMDYRVQELCESRCGRPGIPVPNKPSISVDVKQTSTKGEGQSPGEIKKSDVSWTLTKKLDSFACPGEIKKRKSDAFAGPEEIKRREVVLDPQVSPEEIKSREVELGLRVGLLLLRLLLNSSATDIVLVTLLRTAVETAFVKYTSCCAMARGHCRNIVVVLAAVHGFLGLPGRYARSSLHSFAPFPPCPRPK